MRMFGDLGRALRWLRDSKRRRQYEVAEAAGITKAMLSSYETGRQKPSLETLEKILIALDCSLYDLHDSLLLFTRGAHSGQRRRPREDWITEPGPIYRLDNEAPRRPSPSEKDISRLLGIQGPLAEEEATALSDVIEGFHRLIRYLHESAGDPERSPASRRDPGGGS